MTPFTEITGKDMQSVSVRLASSDASSSAQYGTFFIASRPYEIMEVRAVWSVASSSGTLQLERLQGTTAEDSGDTVLASTISTAGTAHTVVEKKGGDLQNRILREGDRLALKDGGTLTGLSNLVVTVLLKPSARGHYN